MASAKLNDAQWAAVKQHWELDPDQPNLVDAATRAADRLGFALPTKQALHARYKREIKRDGPWERKGTMAGVVQAAQRKADALVESDGSAASKAALEATAQNALQAREQAEDKRAQVLARHRQEWRQVVQLREEALAVREVDREDAFERAKLAKITAEMTRIQQDGERKAWGLDEMQIPDLSKKSDAELRALLSR